MNLCLNAQASISIGSLTSNAQGASCLRPRQARHLGAHRATTHNGTKGEAVKGKELMMRRTLSENHLLSRSAFAYARQPTDSLCMVSVWGTTSFFTGQVPP